ncbi:aminoacrylate hydrolase [Lampropedia cohaerens]|uniref:Putative carbamate hydrolase RutD n=1 Tax=Lampropedia cohaerens TaxID=1610491 RepID=A0A0U1PZB6_9BURK|nr:pyrimidine utilization protein D [Lampropedia cohaerens]KKW67872.1 aminoacrylate hydrolase [Lampropedia cohaerens]
MTDLIFDVHAPLAPANGKTVLLSSGLGGAAGFWKPQLEALLQAGYRAIAYDQRGTGRSPRALPQPYSIAHMAADVLEILDATQTERCHFAGHALGGLVGLQLALDAPQRVASLVLVNAWASPNVHSARCFAARLALLDACGVQAYVEAQPIFLYPADWAEAHHEQVQAEVAHAAAHFPGEANMRARIAALQAFDVEEHLGAIAAPVLLMAAADDVLVPWTRSQRLQQRLPHAELDVVPHGGHAHSVTGPQAFNARLLQFLDRQ